MTKFPLIIGFSGRKQSGKDSSCNFLHGHFMKEMGLVDWFKIDENGKLIVPSDNDPLNGGILELDKFDDYFFDYWMGNHVWSKIRKYSFAFPIKQICVKLLGLSWSQVNGTNEEKQIVTNIKTKKSQRFLTGREVMQLVGDFMRSLNPDCYVNFCLNEIAKMETDIAVITDIRYANEIKKIKENNGKIIRLQRRLRDDDDKHSSEIELDNFKDFDYLLDNSGMCMDEKNSLVLKKITEWLETR